MDLLNSVRAELGEVFRVKKEARTTERTEERRRPQLQVACSPSGTRVCVGGVGCAVGVWRLGQRPVNPFTEYWASIEPLRLLCFAGVYLQRPPGLYSHLCPPSSFSREPSRTGEQGGSGCSFRSCRRRRFQGSLDLRGRPTWLGECWFRRRGRMGRGGRTGCPWSPFGGRRGGSRRPWR